MAIYASYYWGVASGFECIIFLAARDHARRSMSLTFASAIFFRRDGHVRDNQGRLATPDLRRFKSFRGKLQRLRRRELHKHLSP
jgi:hypothetical protein